jgi:hypothetical protein
MSATFKPKTKLEREENIPDGRREPILESECFGSVSPEFTILGQLEESEIDPCYEETELN